MIDWAKHIPKMVMAHRAMHEGKPGFEVHDDERYSITDHKNPGQDFRRVNFANGWHMLTQNMAKDSSNTRAVERARETGGDKWTSWLFDKKGYRARLDTSFLEGDSITRIEDLQTHEVIHEDWDA